LPPPPLLQCEQPRLPLLQLPASRP